MNNEKGKTTCPVCSQELAPDEDCLLCSECGARHHRPCWHRNEACGIKTCASKAKPLEGAVIEDMAYHLDPPRRGQYLRYAALFIAIAALSSFLAVRLLFRGQELPVPSIIGLQLDEARQLLQAKGLKLSVSDEQYDNFVPENSIIAQRPQPGNRVKKGRLVRVTASLGSKIIKVPDFTGQDIRMANLLLLQNSLKAKTNCQLHAANIPRNHVIGQDPPAGAQTARGAPISFLVSLGPAPKNYLMPDLTYHAFEDHLAEFTSDLVQLDRILNEVEDDLPPFTIIKQKPSPGARISHGEKVEITLSHQSTGEVAAQYRLLKVQIPSGPQNKRVRIELKDQLGKKAVIDEDRPAGSFLKLPILVHGRGAVKVFVNGRLTLEREMR